jgi:hypothetical protein
MTNRVLQGETAEALLSHAVSQTLQLVDTGVKANFGRYLNIFCPIFLQHSCCFGIFEAVAIPKF